MTRPREHSDRLFLAASLAFGLGLALVTPPFQVADEPVHFYRAYAVSEGRLALVTRAVDLEVPASVRNIAERLLGDLPFHEEVKIAPGKILAAFRVPLEPERRVKVYSAGSLQYTFVPYLPQAAGIALGRLAGAPPLALLYLGRLANLAFGTLILACALRRLPAYRWLAAAVLLAPMALSLRASVSADVTSTTAAFLFGAGVARLCWGEGAAARGRDLAMVTGAAAILCLSKAPYAPLTLFALAIPASRLPQGRRWRFLAVHLGVTVLAFLYPVLRVLGMPAAMRPGVVVDPPSQIQEALSHPLDFFKMMVTDYVVHTPRYLIQLVGKLGWLDTPLPLAFHFLVLATLLALVLLDAGPHVNVLPWQRILIGISALGTLALISASLYAYWAPAGARHIEGLQGRYFIPVVPIAMWAVHGRFAAGKIPAGRLGLTVMALTVLGFAVSVRAILARYYGV